MRTFPLTLSRPRRGCPSRRSVASSPINLTFCLGHVSWKELAKLPERSQIVGKITNGSLLESERGIRDILVVARTEQRKTTLVLMQAKASRAYESIDWKEKSNAGRIRPAGRRFVGQRSASARALNGKHSSASTSRPFRSEVTHVVWSSRADPADRHQEHL